MGLSADRERTQTMLGLSQAARLTGINWASPTVRILATTTNYGTDVHILKGEYSVAKGPARALNLQPERRMPNNADEEKEHAAMVLEWICRRDPVFDKELREWLFTDNKFGR